MHQKLKWNAIGLEQKTKHLLEALREDRKAIPENNTRELDKIDRFMNELENILKTIDRIKEELISSLESKFRLEFTTPELIMLALSRPSIRSLYDQIHVHFKNKGDMPLRSDEFNELAGSGDAADVLALIGDSVIDLGVVQSFWDSSLATVGALTNQRKLIVSNENLARICDTWKLYDYRLKLNHNPSKAKAKKKTIVHEKGTLIESIYGVIYLEFGFEALIRTLPLIQ